MSFWQIERLNTMQRISTSARYKRVVDIKKLEKLRNGWDDIWLIVTKEIDVDSAWGFVSSQFQRKILNVTMEIRTWRFDRFKIRFESIRWHRTFYYQLLKLDQTTSGLESKAHIFACFKRPFKSVLRPSYFRIPVLTKFLFRVVFYDRRSWYRLVLRICEISLRLARGMSCGSTLSHSVL